VYVDVQQLQQSTEPSCADFACIGRCLSRLGEFLSRLNNSIECSMAAVSTALAASPPSPKPRRRFQFSFRSSLLDTSDAIPRPPAVRDPLRRYDSLLYIVLLFSCIKTCLRSSVVYVVIIMFELWYQFCCSLCYPSACTSVYVHHRLLCHHCVQQAACFLC